ncbi:protein of unknown function [Acetitomaculum ruminis DSM 5522]|uniref:DUF4956 domain-containing protein n=1 Tax=Acetitomaculum ruminis DSM 5522 TaxID=1120918 RepID=A0A1I0XZK8_9FIRM|nr:DUF4956 domain-containing protein [Acetitomaculum ruminis]SFB06067.1 protein of unknown function [Acetitomaculum ruminis DSM 5522]
MFDSILSTTFNINITLICLACALAYGLIISLTYIFTGKYTKNFVNTLVVLPIIVCVVVTLVNGNLGTSVAILGAFSLIRFRSLQGNSRDIAYIFFAMASGLTASMGYVAFGFVFVLFVAAVYFILYFIRFGNAKTLYNELRITIPENLDYSNIFDDVFEKYLKSSNLTRVKTTNLGSMYELYYDIALNDLSKTKEFIDEIRCRNGNLTVICGKKDFDIREEL